MKARFAILLPVLWMLSAIVSYSHPGDEYALFFYASIAGSWVIYLIQGMLPSIGAYSACFIAVGALAMTGAGYLMDKARVNWKVALVLFLAIAALLLSLSLAQYPTWERAMGKNGSLTAYVAFASTLGLTLAAPISLAARGVEALWRKTRRPTISDPESQGSSPMEEPVERD